VGEPAGERIGVGGLARKRAAREAVWQRDMDQAHGEAVGFGIDAAPARAAEENRLKNSRPLLSPPIRLPREMLNEVKVLANKKDIPYQSLIKVYLADKIKEERKH
jgi:hypothetical protein